MFALWDAGTTRRHMLIVIREGFLSSKTPRHSKTFAQSWQSFSDVLRMSALVLPSLRAWMMAVYEVSMLPESLISSSIGSE